MLQNDKSESDFISSRKKKRNVIQSFQAPFVSALCSGVFSQPEHPREGTNIVLINRVLTFLSSLYNPSPIPDVQVEAAAVSSPRDEDLDAAEPDVRKFTFWSFGCWNFFGAVDSSCNRALSSVFRSLETPSDSIMKQNAVRPTFLSVFCL